MQANYVVEEGASDGGRRVRVAQWDEMGVLREPVNHGEDNTFTVDLGERLHEVHGDVGLDTGGHRQRLEKAGEVQSLGFVPLAGSTCANVVADDAPVMLDEEPRVEPLKHFLDPLVTRGVSELEDVREQHRCTGDEHVVVVEDQAVAERRFGHIVRMDVNLVVSRPKVQLRENLAPWSLSSNSSTTGIGNLSFTVTEFNAR